MNVFVLQSHPKRVARIDESGKILMIYPSQTDAASCTGADQSRISKVCRGLVQTANGMRFKSLSYKEYKELKAAGVRCSE